MNECEEYDIDMLVSMLDDDQFQNVKEKEPESKPMDRSSEDLEQELIKMKEKMAAMEEELRRKKENETKEREEKLKVPTMEPVKKVPSKLKDVGLNNLFERTKEEEEEKKNETPKRSLTTKEESVIHTGDTDSSDEESNRDPMSNKYNEFGNFVRKRIARRETQTNREQITTKPRNNQRINSSKNATIEENVVTDLYSGIRIMNPLVSSLEMKERMDSRKMIRLSSIRLHIRGDDIEGDWVTIGVIVNKTEPKKSAKGNLYSIWKLSDLKDIDKVVSLFLFGKNHEQHWKTSVGSVVGVLNANLMPNKESGNKGSELCLTIDHPQKVMLMGVSKDFGHCKSKRKDGANCTMYINKSECEFCPFHIQKEYRKSCSKRSDLQASYSGPEPSCFRAKLLQKQQVMYGGQLYVNPRPEKKTKKAISGKDKLTLGSLKLQKKASEMAKEERTAINAFHLTTEENKILNDIGDQCNAFGKMLCVPTAGSRNLLTHLKTNDVNSPSSSSSPLEFKSITPKELLKLHAKEMASKVAARPKPSAITERVTTLSDPAKHSQLDVSNNLPKLGKGFQPGEEIYLDFEPSKKPFMDKAKLTAIQKVKSSLSILKEDPNNIKAARTSTDFQEKVKKRLAYESCDEEEAQPSLKKSRKPTMDGSSEKFLAILNRKSKYDNLLEEENAKRQEKYFNELEKKEKIETKMCSTMEVQCSAYSCKKCNYTAFSALETCRKEGHHIVTHKATKRFFKCNECSRRTVSLCRLPTKPCSGCGSTNYERVAMCKEKNGPKLESEQLCIRGAEQTFVNSHSVVNI